MSLPAPDLDDRSFQDIVDEAKRLIPRYCPEWTNHNLSDPGVALIELFAWMSEMVLYRVNQVPDRLYAKFLGLMGVDPFPPSVAETRLTFVLSAPVDEVVRVPAGTEVSTAAVGEEPVVFSTTEELAVAQPELTGCLAGFAGDERWTDAWDDLRYGKAPVTCFPSTPLAAGDAVYFGFDRSLAGNLIQLQVSASIEGFGVDPSQPPLVWEVWSGEAWIPCTVESDTTGGLNRDGLVVLHIPLAHENLTLGGVRGHWLRARLTVPPEGVPGYHASPQLRGLAVASLGGTVHAEHAQVVGGEVLGRSDGGPGQQYDVRQPPVLPRRDGESVEIVVDGRAEAWMEVDDFSASGPEDRHVHWDDATGRVSFGPRIRYPDGTTRQHGAIPADGAEIQVTGYRNGGGASGNVGSGTLVNIRTSIPFVNRVSNLEPARGGVDAETVENAKQRGPLSLRTGQRAVTASDFERLTLESSPAVARARCLPPTAPGGPVRVLVVPQVRVDQRHQHLDDFALGDPLVARISSHLDERRTLGAVVEVGTPYYQGVTIAALVQALPGRPATQVRERALDLLHRFVDPLTGGVDGNGWPFDTDLNAATIAQLLEAVDGLERVEEVLLFEYDLRTGERHGLGRELVRLDAHSLFLSAAHQVVVR
jgi:predicted phage baseplate assembly protein